MMFLEEATKILQFISAFLLILFAVVILSQKRGQFMPRFFLSAFFISRSLILLGFVSYFYYEAIYSYPDLFMIGYPYLFLYAPFLFLYTRSVTTYKPRLHWYDSMHFLPFLAVMAYLLMYFHFAPHDMKIKMLLGDELFDSFLINGNMLWLQFGVYAIACAYLLVIYKARIEQFNSSYRHDRFNWLVFLVGAFLLWKGIFVSGYLFGIFEGESAYIFKILIELGFLFYASMIAYKGLQMPHVVLSIDQEEKYRNSPLTTQDRMDMISNLDRAMIEDKAWQNPDLTLGQLAQMTAIPVYHLSQILNNEIKQNFYNYVNTYRIKAAQKILSDPEKADLTILEILYEVGFNSKSVFNTAFKKHSGKTPTAYRKAMQEHAA